MAGIFAHSVDREARSRAANIMDRCAVACGQAPYALVAFIVRLVAARAVFVDGQARIAGPTILLPSVHGAAIPFILPAQVRSDALGAAATQFASVPLPPTLMAYCLAYAEFVLPICLVVGFGTRASALLLLILTGIMQVYVAPAALWTVHAYWIALFLVLMTCGAGAISLDGLIGRLYRT